MAPIKLAGFKLCFAMVCKQVTHWHASLNRLHHKAA